MANVYRNMYRGYIKAENVAAFTEKANAAAPAIQKLIADGKMLGLVLRDVPALDTVNTALGTTGGHTEGGIEAMLAPLLIDIDGVVPVPSVGVLP